MCFNALQTVQTEYLGGINAWASSLTREISESASKYERNSFIN